MSAVLGFLTALPQIVTLINEMWNYINKVSGNDPAGYLVKLGEAFSELNAATTQEDHANAAKNLADLIRNSLPK